MRTVWRGVSVAVALAAGLVLCSLRPGLAAVTVVNTLSLDGWASANEGPVDSLALVTLAPGPLGAPLGLGSARLEVDDTGRASFGTFIYKGTALSTITQLTYSSYTESVKSDEPIVLQFDVDYDGTDMDTSYQGRLTYVPAGPVTTDAWVSHDALAGTWYASRAPGNTVCPQSTPCTWAQVLSAFPNAIIRNDLTQPGALLFRLGGPVPGGAVAHVDNFTIGISTIPTTYDFEPGATTNPTIGGSGTIITLQAYGFKAGATVNAYYFTNLVPPLRPRKVRICQSIAWNTPDLPAGTGAFYCAIPVPSSPTDGPSGVHDIVIYGRSATARRNLVYTTGFAVP